MTLSFFRLIVQNEHYDDWNGPVLFRLKCLLNEYKNSMAKYHETCQMPPARNSTAQEGNFLETINMCATVFARHNIDRGKTLIGLLNTLTDVSFRL